MFRGTTTRTVISALAAVLLALQFFAPSTSFASAHTVGHVEAKAQPGSKLSPKALRDGLVTFRDAGCSGDPTGPQHTRERNRTTVAWPGAQERPLAAPGTAAALHPAKSAAHRRTARSSTSHSPATLQVFRC
ncbi:hypothetical protein AB0L99_11865 [Streptomyces sp. NPDC051954]|uniref:hypothetical protein n=1 Tax=unclassified Streptomyces TaxID=2593676 RepID=UPI003426DE42